MEKEETPEKTITSVAWFFYYLLTIIFLKYSNYFQPKR